MFGFKMGQRAKALLSGLFGKQEKRILAGLIAASGLHVGLASDVEAHWWNRCYSRAHYVLPSHCGWHHYGYRSYSSFPSYAHWYSFGPACYPSVAHCYPSVASYHVSFRPIVYRPVFCPPVYHRAPVFLPSVNVVRGPQVLLLGQSGAGTRTSADLFESSTHDWVDGAGVWGQRVDKEPNPPRAAWVSNSARLRGESSPSIAKTEVSTKQNNDGELKQLTWEEAIYGSFPSGPTVRLVSHRNESIGDSYSDWFGENAEFESNNGFVIDDLNSQDLPGIYVSPESSLIDEMVQSGNSYDAHQSLLGSSLASGRFDSSLQLRNAVLSLFASKEPIAVELVLDRFNQACATGAFLNDQALGMKISDYLAPCHIDVTNTLNEFSKLALRNEEDSVSHLLIVATLLRLDGQLARSKIFAQSAFDQASEKGNLQWNSLMTTLLQ